MDLKEDHTRCLSATSYQSLGEEKDKYTCPIEISNSFIYLFIYSCMQQTLLSVYCVLGAAIRTVFYFQENRGQPTYRQSI